MNQELAGAAMQFLMRVQLTGQEVPAFNAVMNELDAMARAGAPTPVAPAAPASPTA